MHGRQKKERSAEEEDAKQKEHAKKVTAYKYAMGLVFSKRAKSELDDELLKITGQVLAANPDIGTLWNIRKEVLTIMKDQDYANFCDVIVPKELDFSEFCLKSNPKSYGAWNHRYWLMRETKFSKVTSELKLIAKYLEFDDRNFHGWDYRRYLLNNCPEITLEQELEFTTEKISLNFSNFSSWHLRSKILPRLPRNFLEEELELIRNAVFTDPKDQSAWFYHRWLLRSQLPTDKPRLIAAQHSGMQITLIFSSKSPIPSELGIEIDADGSKVTKGWCNPWSNTCSKLWQYKISEPVKCVTICGPGPVMAELGSAQITLKPEEVKANFPSYFDAETAVGSGNNKVQDLLKEEISWVQELQELEPDIKWPISTLIMLMRMVDFVGYKQKILEFLDTLINLDSKRMNYYLDLRSKYLIEWKLLECCKLGVDTTCLNLSGLNLTALYYPERMFLYKKINLSSNTLRNCEPFRALLNCTELDVSGNKLAETSVKSAIQMLTNLKC